MVMGADAPPYLEPPFRSFDALRAMAPDQITVPTCLGFSSNCTAKSVAPVQYSSGEPPFASAELLGDAQGAASELDEEGKARGSRGGFRKKKVQHQDFASQFTNHSGPLSSYMLCNIPCRITQEQLAEAIDSVGFKDKYDFLYLPSGGRSSKSGANLGYGFINFVDPSCIDAFTEEFESFKFHRTSSQKVCTVKPAHVQGFENNMRSFCQGNSSRCPILSTSGSTSATEPLVRRQPGAAAWTA
jgi:hypothetical protein